MHGSLRFLLWEQRLVFLDTLLFEAPTRLEARYQTEDTFFFPIQESCDDQK